MRIGHGLTGRRTFAVAGTTQGRYNGWVKGACLRSKHALCALIDFQVSGYLSHALLYSLAAQELMSCTILQVCYFFKQSPFQQFGQDAVCNACEQTCVSPPGAQAALATVKPSPCHDGSFKVQA